MYYKCTTKCTIRSLLKSTPHDICLYKTWQFPLYHQVLLACITSSAIKCTPDEESGGGGQEEEYQPNLPPIRPNSVQHFLKSAFVRSFGAERGCVHTDSETCFCLSDSSRNMTCYI